MRKLTPLFLLILVFTSCHKSKNELRYDTVLVQTMPVSDNESCKFSLLSWGFSKVSDQEKLKSKLKLLQNDFSGNSDIIGLGATSALNDEITFAKKNVYKIYSDNGEIKTKPLKQNEGISFAQVGILDGRDIKPNEFYVKEILSSNEDSSHVHEINNNKDSVFTKILKFISNLEGHDEAFTKESYIISIEAKTRYIKTRAVNSIIEETGEKLQKSIDLLTHISGGYIVYDKSGKIIKTFSNSKLSSDKNLQNELNALKNKKGIKIQTVRPHTVKEIHHKNPQKIVMYGVIIGSGVKESAALKGLHVHYNGGHILDLGSLYDVKMALSGIRKIEVLCGNYAISD